MMHITTLNHHRDNSTGGKTKRIAAGVLQSITALWLICAKQAITASRKLKDNSKIQRPRKLIASISSKAMGLRHGRDRRGGAAVKDDVGPDFGDHGGLWQKEILMGDKCQPLDFSGVIYYDRQGNPTNEFPMRSPRASPFPAYVAKYDWSPPRDR